jgi:hypothetical protein
MSFVCQDNSPAHGVCWIITSAFAEDMGLPILYDPEVVRIGRRAGDFHAAFSAIAGEVIYMAAPGALPPNPRQIVYRRLDTTGWTPGSMIRSQIP